MTGLDNLRHNSYTKKIDFAGLSLLFAIAILGLLVSATLLVIGVSNGKAFTSTLNVQGINLILYVGIVVFSSLSYILWSGIQNIRKDLRILRKRKKEENTFSQLKSK